VRSLTGGIIAIIVGLFLAGAIAVAVVQQQQASGEAPIEAGTVSYGTNG